MLLCFFISCEKKESNFSEEMIKKFAAHNDRKDIAVIINPYFYLDLYIRTNHDTIFITNAIYLHESYKRRYSKKYKTFKEFLETILNEDYVFNESNQKIIFSRNFKINSKIKNQYSDLGFDEFLKRYSKKSFRKDELELNRSIIKTEEYSTIKYLLYLNGYDVISECLKGIDYIRKREDFF